MAGAVVALGTASLLTLGTDLDWASIALVSVIAAFLGLVTATEGLRVWGGR